MQSLLCSGAVIVLSICFDRLAPSAAIETMSTGELTSLLKDISACTICTAHLPLGANPVVRAHRDARLLIIGQAPGIRVHESGVPWDDPSGDRLRDWLAIDKDTFYGNKVAIVPMGFCYRVQASRVINHRGPSVHRFGIHVCLRR